MIRSFFREFLRKRAILNGIACPRCQSLETERVSGTRRQRLCRACGMRWDQYANNSLVDGELDL